MPNQCPICLNVIIGEICGFHTQDEDHAIVSAHSKVMNDFLMRGKTPNRLPKNERPLEGENDG